MCKPRGLTASESNVLDEPSAAAFDWGWQHSRTQCVAPEDLKRALAHWPDSDRVASLEMVNAALNGEESPWFAHVRELTLSVEMGAALPSGIRMMIQNSKRVVVNGASVETLRFLAECECLTSVVSLDLEYVKVSDNAAALARLIASAPKLRAISVVTPVTGCVWAPADEAGLERCAIRDVPPRAAIAKAIASSPTIESVRLSYAVHSAEHLQMLTAGNRLTTLELDGNLDEGAVDVLVEPSTHKLSTLALDDPLLVPSDFRMLAASQLNLRTVRIQDSSFDDDAATELSRGNFLSRVEVLDLHDSRPSTKLGRRGLMAIGSAASNLRELDLSNRKVGNAGAATFEHFGSRGLQRLVMPDCGLGPEAVSHIGRLGREGTLETVNLFGNRILDSGVIALTRTGALNRAETLDLGESGMTSAGLKFLVESGTPNHVRSLGLRGNNLGEVGIRELSAVAWPRLRELDLSGVRIDTADLQVLISADMPELRVLSLEWNGLGAESLSILAQWEGAPKLEHLALRGNPLEDSGVAEFAASPRFKRLQTVDLGDYVMKADEVRDIAGRCPPNPLLVIKHDWADLPTDSLRAFAGSPCVSIAMRSEAAARLAQRPDGP